MESLNGNCFEDGRFAEVDHLLAAFVPTSRAFGVLLFICSDLMYISEATFDFLFRMFPGTHMSHVTQQPQVCRVHVTSLEEDYHCCTLQPTQ